MKRIKPNQRSESPQRVTVDGEETTVNVAASDYDREHEAATGTQLVKAFQHAAAAYLEFERSPIPATFREVDL